MSVVSHDQDELVAQLLDCLARDGSPFVTALVLTRNVVAENAAGTMPACWNDVLRRWRDRMPDLDVHLVDNPSPKGFGANHNAAFRHCHEPWFCVLNPDITWTDAPWPALRQQAGREDLAVVAPTVVSPDGRIENSARALYTPADIWRQKRHRANRPADPAWLAGMFLLIDAGVYRRLGGFDERYFLYVEDVDLCTRARVAGYRLAQSPQATVVHDARRGSHRSLRHAAWHVQGMLRYWSSPGFLRLLLGADGGR